MEKEKPIVSIHMYLGEDDMSEVIKWLRDQVEWLEKNQHNISKTFHARLFKK